MPNLIEDSARERLAFIVAALDGGSEPGAIRTGVAQLRDQESASELIERADRQLIETRR